MTTPPQEEPRRHGLPQGSQSPLGSGSESGALAACSLGCLAIAFFVGVIWASIYMAFY